MGGAGLILLDTHMWIWYNISPKELPAELTTVFDEGTEEFVLSAASVWETLVAIEKGRVATQASPEDTVRAWLSASPIRVVPIDAEITLLSRSLAFVHEDPADRFIAATAFQLGCPLATIDQRLRGLKWLRVFPAS